MKPMASNRANTSISLDEQVPAALSMMVDSMTSMVERAKIDLENVDQRARADLENIDQRARKDVALLDQRARKDIAILDKRAREDHELLRKVRKSRELTS
tara:strand:- start:152 stop:451 length:300 start_codon:yes stop_codon:yes gene_type:complete